MCERQVVGEFHGGSNLRVHKGVPDIRAHSEWVVAADHSAGGGGGGGAGAEADQR